jgi:hypothetical protein
LAAQVLLRNSTSGGCSTSSHLACRSKAFC